MCLQLYENRVYITQKFIFYSYVLYVLFIIFTLYFIFSVKVVEVLGQEKALELYSETQKVEKKGGVMILNGARRRTSGGVYLYLLRTSFGVEKSQLCEIFADNNKDSQQQHQQSRKRKRNRNKKKISGT